LQHKEFFEKSPRNILLPNGVNASENSSMHRAIEIARDLIAIPSINSMGEPKSDPLYAEKGMATYIGNFLHSIGVQCELFGKDPEHPNLIAHIDAGQKETILLEAHMDTVPHYGMTIDPFNPVIENGLLYGRGSCDTKSSIATYLYAIEHMVKTNKKFKKNVILAFVHDEEYSFGGAKELMARGIKADYGIVGEPTSLNIVYAHKGVCRFFIETKGISCHAAMPWLGENAIYKMTRVLQKIESYAENLLHHKHDQLGHATISVGKIVGGQAVNIVPSSCSVEVDHRLLPGGSYETIKQSLLNFIGNEVEYEILPPYFSCLSVHNEFNNKPCSALEQACIAANIKPTFEIAHYVTDASVYANGGVPCVVFGPGSIDQAHTKNEFIPIADIEKASEVIINLISD
jgi:acetylornithine deacetylase/succinyl-diaminopimelate desuccinylase family protein